MGLFDKIKDNAKNISIKAIEDVENDAYTVVPENTYPLEASTHEPDEAIQVESNEAIDTTPLPIEEPKHVESSKPDATPKKKEEPKQKPKEEPTQTPDKTDGQSSVTVRKEPAKTKEPEAQKAPEQPEILKPEPKPAPKQAPRSESKDPAIRPMQTSSGRVLDVTPHKVESPKQAIFARERAAMTALATQRRMNGAVPLFVTSHLNFKTRVFIDRVEYSGSFGKNVLPIEQIAWIKLRAGGTGIILETTAQKRVVMVVKPKDRLEFADAVMKVQAIQPKREKFKDTQTVRLDQLDQFGEGIDEIEKLARLYEKRIITKEEFDTKKKQILGI
jgi:hypothetical protein